MSSLIAQGMRFGRLTASELSERRGYWVCECECGARKDVRADHLRSGLTQSCGCLRGEMASARAHVMHKANTKHGLSKSPIYSVWNGMKSRCLDASNAAFAGYGGRGITVCERWMTFENFLADMGEPPFGGTLDRLDNEGNYTPNNCAWRTRKEQQNNRRVNHLVKIGRKEFTLSQAAEAFGIPRNTINARLARGLSPKEAVSPQRKTNMEQFRQAIFASAVARKARTHCKYGHEWTPENTGQQKTGRYCKRCAANKTAGRPKGS